MVDGSKRNIKNAGVEGVINMNFKQELRDSILKFISLTLFVYAIGLILYAVLTPVDLVSLVLGVVLIAVGMGVAKIIEK